MGYVRIYSEQPIGPITITTHEYELPGGMCTAIPRYKIAFLPGNASELYLVHGRNGTGGSVWRSTDKGANWTTIGTQQITDYHVNLDVDSSSRVYLGVPCGYDGSPDDPGELRRWNGSSWDSDVAFDDFSGAYSTVHILKGSGNDVFAFTRSTYGGSGIIYWHRSTDNGVNFSSAAAVVDTADTNYKRMGGAFIDGNPACLVGYDTGSVYRYRFFRWDGIDSFDAISNDAHDAASNDPMNRIWGFSELPNGQLHLVYRDIVSSNYVLRHTYRGLTGSWGPASTIHTLAGSSCGELTLTHVGNTLCLAYSDSPVASMQIFYRTWTSGGGWSSATQLSQTESGECYNCNSARVIPNQSWPIMWQQTTSIMFKTVVI